MRTLRHLSQNMGGQSGRMQGSTRGLISCSTSPWPRIQGLWIVYLSKNVSKCSKVGLTSMVDVGGGTGETAKGIAHAFPELKCIVLDLPHVVAGLEGSENVNFVSGDMLFDSIPHADAVFFKWVLHVLSDKDCLRVLKKCKEAISGSKINNGGKVIIVENVLEDRKDDERATQTQLYFDMQMLALFNAKERTEKEWANIFLQAGFHSYNITRLSGFRSIIEVFP